MAVMVDYRLLFVERLGEHDLRVLAALDDASTPIGHLRDRLTAHPEGVDSYLGDPRLFEFLFEAPEDDDLRVISSALAFAVIVHRTIADLEATNFVSEWVGAGERLPVFDVGSLREFIDDLTRRYVIIELLSSFTRVASGSMWVRTRNGYRRRRYSELDPVSLAEMVESLPATHRPAGYRRLGDVALFLTGVFPDHTARHPLSAMRRERLVRATGVDIGPEVTAEYVRFLEVVGSRWYGRAASGPFLAPEGQQSLHDMAANFTQARRFLNYLADTYLHRFETGLMNPVA